MKIAVEAGASTLQFIFDDGIAFFLLNNSGDAEVFLPDVEINNGVFEIDRVNFAYWPDADDSLTLFTTNTNTSISSFELNSPPNPRINGNFLVQNGLVTFQVVGKAHVPYRIFFAF